MDLTMVVGHLASHDYEIKTIQTVLLGCCIGWFLTMSCDICSSTPDPGALNIAFRGQIIPSPTGLLDSV